MSQKESEVLPYSDPQDLIKFAQFQADAAAALLKKLNIRDAEAWDKAARKNARLAQKLAVIAGFISPE